MLLTDTDEHEVCLERDSTGRRDGMVEAEDDGTTDDWCAEDGSVYAYWMNKRRHTGSEE